MSKIIKFKFIAQTVLLTIYRHDKTIEVSQLLDKHIFYVAIIIILNVCRVCLCKLLKVTQTSVFNFLNICKL